MYNNAVDDVCGAAIDWILKLLNKVKSMRKREHMRMYVALRVPIIYWINCFKNNNLISQSCNNTFYTKYSVIPLDCIYW